MCYTNLIFKTSLFTSHTFTNVQLTTENDRSKGTWAAVLYKNNISFHKIQKLHSLSGHVLLSEISLLSIHTRVQSNAAIMSLSDYQQMEGETDDNFIQNMAIVGFKDL